MLFLFVRQFMLRREHKRRKDFSGLPVPRRGKIVAVVLALLWSGTVVSVAEGGRFQTVLRNLSKHLTAQSDELAQRLGKLLDQLGQQTDEALQHVGKELNPRATTTDALLDSFKRLGIPISEELQKTIRSLDDVGRGAVAGLVEESSTLLRRWTKLEKSFDELTKAIQTGGPEVVWACRQMRTDEALESVVRFTNEFGPDFVSFVRKADEPGVSTISKHFDELKRARNNPQLKTRVEDIWKNPAKYLDEFGKPTKAFDELLAGIKKGLPSPPSPGPIRRLPRTIWTTLTASVAAIGHFLWAATATVARPLLGALAAFIPLAGQALWAAAIQIVVLLFLALLALLWLLPIGLRVFNWLFWKLLQGFVRWQGHKWPRLVEWTKQHQDRVTEETYISAARKMHRGLLRIGLLGIQRVGKTTFMVMLSKHLHRAFPGASLRPYRDQDHEVLQQMENEVRFCQRTSQQRELALALTWPFFWETPEDAPPAPKRPDAQADQRAGKLELALEVVDYPGEWALQQDTRQKLKEFLQGVDGLFVVVDPTDLEQAGPIAPTSESSSPPSRTEVQRHALECMFAKDRLDLGHSFTRSLGILLTKRDAWTEPMLRRLAEKQGRVDEQKLAHMVELAKKPRLSPQESEELGRGVFELLYPGHFAALQTRLEESCRPKPSWWGRLWRRMFPWFSLDSKPQLRIFAVSQLGVPLGKQVVEYRQKIQQWECQGRPGPQPQIQLDLDSADPSELDILHAFPWMFNSIPEGWLWTAQRQPAGFWWYFPVLWRFFSPKGRIITNIQRRFEGAPAIQRNIAVLRRHAQVTFGVGCAVLIFLGFWGSAAFRQSEISEGKSLLVQAQQNLSKPEALDEISQKLQTWREESLWAAKDYQGQAEYAVQLLKDHKELEKLRGQLRQENISLEERGHLCQRWFARYVDLPAPPEGCLEELQSLYKQVQQPVDTIAQSLIEHLDQEVSQKANQTNYEEAYSLISKARNWFTPLPDSLRSQCENKLKEIEKRHARIHAQWMWDKTEKEIQELLKQANPLESYPKAVQRGKETFFPTQLAEGDREKFERQKAERLEDLAQQWFDRLKHEIILDEGKPEKAHELCEEFRKRVHWGKWPEEIAQLRKTIADEFVRSSVEKANTLTSQGDYEKAKEQLESCRPYVRQCQPENQPAWYDAHIRIFRTQEAWTELIEFIDTIPAHLRDAQWNKNLKDEVTKAWQNWSEKIEELFRTPDPRIEDLEKKISWAKARGDMPTEIQQKLPEWEKRMLPLKFTRAMKQTEDLIKEGKLTDAHRLLDQFQPSLRNLPPKERKDWFERKLELFKREPNYLGAYRWLEGLDSTIFPDADFSQKRSELLNQAVQKSQDDFHTYLKKEPQTAFSFLWNETSSSARPNAYREKLSPWAETEVKSYIHQQKSEHIDQYIKQQQYDQAKLAVDRLKKELDQWAERPRFREQLEELAKEIEAVRVSSKLDTLEKEIHRLATDTPIATFNQLYQQLQALQPRLPQVQDDQKKRWDALQERLLTTWEKVEYENLRTYRNALDLDKLDEGLKRYLDKQCPYRKKSTPERLNAAQQLQQWFQAFDALRTYQISEIHTMSIPEGWIQNFKFAFRIHIDQNQESYGPFPVGGDHRIDLPKAIELKWKPGMRVEVEIWHKEVDKQGSYVGKIAPGGKYGLLKLLLDAQNIDTSDTAFQEYNWANARIRLHADGIYQPPPLPKQ